ncbi:MAG: HEAT repeat domain-containing protein [Anaerolineae bacterium]
MIKALIEALGDEDIMVQAAAAVSLNEGCFKPASLLRSALSDRRLSVRQTSADILASFPSAETEASLRQALSDESPHVRGAAARSLRDMEIQEVTIDVLQQLLKDPELFPRYQVLIILNTVVPGAVDEHALIQRDLYAVEPKDRVAAIHFVRETNQTEWMNEIARLREDAHFSVRRADDWAWRRLNGQPQ